MDIVLILDSIIDCWQIGDIYYLQEAYRLYFVMVVF